MRILTALFLSLTNARKSIIKLNKSGVHEGDDQHNYVDRGRRRSDEDEVVCHNICICFFFCVVFRCTSLLVSTCIVSVTLDKALKLCQRNMGFLASMKIMRVSESVLSFERFGEWIRSGLTRLYLWGNVIGIKLTNVAFESKRN